MVTFPAIPYHVYPGTEGPVNILDTDETQPIRESEEENYNSRNNYSSAHSGVPTHVSHQQDARKIWQFQQFLPFGSISWELPFLQGWLMGQQTLFPSMRPHSGTGHENLTQCTGSSSALQQSVGNTEATASSLGMPNSISQSIVFGRTRLQNDSQSRLVSEAGEVSVPSNSVNDGTDAERIVSRMQTELATSMDVAAAVEFPCTVKLTVWSHDIKNPCALLNVANAA